MLTKATFFPTKKIFYNTKFFIPLLQLGNIFPTPDFVICLSCKIFCNAKFVYIFINSVGVGILLL